MSVQTDYYIPQLKKADEQISKQASVIRDQRQEIETLRDALERIADGIWRPEILPHAVIGYMRAIAREALGSSRPPLTTDEGT